MKKFKRAYIEITNVCNLSCAFCPGTSRSPGFMNLRDFEVVLRKLSGFTDYLYFHVMGEPLLHPELAHFLEQSGIYGYRVNITTNGSLVGKHEKTLLESPALRQVNFSLHSHEEQPDTDKLERYLDGIFDYTARALAKGGIYISFRLWNLNSDAADRYNRHIAKKLEQRFNPGFSVAEALEHTGRVKLGDGLFLNSAEVFQWPSKTANETGSAGFCLGLRDQIAVLTDGTVVPCCLDSDGTIALGNLFEQELPEILESERSKILYEGFSGRHAVEELCRRCGYRSRFS